MKESEYTHAYIGIAKCGCVRAAVVDDPDPKRAKFTAETVAEFIQAGMTVERVSILESGTRLKLDLGKHKEHARPKTNQ